MTAPLPTDLNDSILAGPDDDLPRLIMADALEARDLEGDRDRALFIRAQIEFAKLPNACQKTGQELDDGSELTSPRNFVKNCRCEVCRLRRAAYRHGCRYIGLDWCPTQTLYKEDYNRWVWQFGQRVAEITGDPDADRHLREYTLPDLPFLTFRWRRGFPDEAKCTLAAWAGTECRKCGPCTGWHNGPGTPECPRHRHHHCDFRCRVMKSCKACRGTGEIESLAGRVMEKWPITKVNTEKVPYSPYGITTVHIWHGSGGRSNGDPQNQVPEEVFKLLKGYDRRSHPNTRHGIFKNFQSAPAARIALSDALVDFGKQQATARKVSICNSETQLVA